MITSKAHQRLGTIFEAPFTEVECSTLCDSLDRLLLGRRIRVTYHGPTLEKIGQTYQTDINTEVTLDLPSHLLRFPMTGIVAHLKPIHLTAHTIRPRVFVARDGARIESRLRELDGRIRFENIVLQPILRDR